MTSTSPSESKLEILIGRDAARKVYVFRVQGLHQILLVATTFLSVTAKLRNCGALEAHTAKARKKILCFCITHMSIRVFTAACHRCV